MTEPHLEVEAKYEADAAFEMPDLAALVESVRGDGRAPEGDHDPWTAGEAATQRLRATYFDTAELDLVRAGLTLRRRTGGADAGWHLKVPTADRARSEVRLPLGRGTTEVPAELESMTYAVTLGRALVPVVRIVTARTVRQLVDGAGRVRLEVADDRVTARRLAAPGTSERDGDDEVWREVEVELVDADPGLLDALDPALRASGLVPAGSASKLARVLGPVADDGAVGHGAAPVNPRPVRAGRWRRSSPAGDVALAHIGAQVDQIRALDLPVRLDAPGAVHAMRVASRRLRSALRTYEPLLRAHRTRPLGIELRWLAGVLGQARDAEVMRDRVVGSTEQHGSADLDDGARDEVRGELDATYRAAHDDVLAQLDGERYRELLAALTGFMADPPLRGRARRPAGDVLPRLVGRSERRVRRTMRAAHAADDAARREELLHDARKAAKRARYAAESAAPVFGRDARRLAAAMEAVQEHLGDHLDSLNTRARLTELASRTPRPSTAFALGRLHAQEEVRAEQSAARADAAWRAAKKERLRRWLR
ncbi:CYTH and CHAD domain-containing protein [uncultured Cellulomonas sp.]|uniref:CYTH and CHAD domain-containing protein n=1 Tax=uncultured Cellulomonas sp. TaxID=189682 RepID=UPI00263A380C|nr:CYTH and CHAD domain-containing protein [uncultured Cellulomonas sp.]